jgi:pimeloyl-ACP methyl ester carboxylesterase
MGNGAPDRDGHPDPDPDPDPGPDPDPDPGSSPHPDADPGGGAGSGSKSSSGSGPKAGIGPGPGSTGGGRDGHGPGRRPDAAGREAADIPPEVPGESRYVETNGVELHVVDAGPASGDLVVLLHGFPEFWYGWHEAIRPLTNAGYRVVVPDQRGYNLSEKPEGVESYRMPELSADLVGLVDAYGRESAAVVGHDWGGAVGWWTALHRPDRVSKLVAAASPHPTVFRRTLERSWPQRLRSWYIAAFQLPALPERLARLGNWRLPVRSMRRSSRPGTFSTVDFERYRGAWSRPGAFAAMVNWYRAAARDPPEPDATHVRAPTLLLWGGRDEFFERSLAHESAEYCTDGRLLTVDEATHWIHHEEPIRIAEGIADHLAGIGGGPGPG